MNHAVAHFFRAFVGQKTAFAADRSVGASASIRELNGSELRQVVGGVRTVKAQDVGSPNKGW